MAKLSRAAALDTIVGQAGRDRRRLDSGAMGPFSLTTLGIASVVGAGIFVTTGEAAARYAGPAVILSFLLAGIAAGVTALCYAELAAMIPAAGSTYSYAYAVFGVFVAWFIGWDLLLEYLFAASTVAVGWSGYAVSLMGSVGIDVPGELAAPPFGSGSGWINLPAIATVVQLGSASTAAAEARRPQRTVPLGLLATVAISTALYVGIGLVMTGLVRYTALDVADPLSRALDAVGPSVDWLNAAVDVAAVVGLASTVLVTFYGQTRILMRMSSDGMLPPAFARIGERSKTPVFSTWLCGVLGAAVAGLVPIDVLGELVSIGTLLAFLIVCAGVVVLRRTRPELERPFRVPRLQLVASVGIVSALGLMVTLPVDTFVRLVVWLLIGLSIFFLYARRHTAERFAELQRADAG